MKNKRIAWNVAALVLAVLLVAVVGGGWSYNGVPANVGIEDGIERIDLNTIHLQASEVEVDFTDVILSKHNETRKLIVSVQKGNATIELTERVTALLDIEWFKKTQSVSYAGTGYFVVDLDNLMASDIIVDKKNRTVTIRIGHAYLQAIEIDSDKIIIDEVKEGLLAHGDITMTVSDYNAIEKEILTQLEKKFNTAANGQVADANALAMVREIYEPIVKAVDRRYSVVVEFKK